MPAHQELVKLLTRAHTMERGSVRLLEAARRHAGGADLAAV